MATVGFAGLGRMGRVMAPRLIDAGFELVVWNRSAAAAEELRQAGAKLVEQPGDIWGYTDIVVAMLRDCNATRSVMTSERGLLCAGSAGRLICDMATHAPADTAMLGTVADKHGVRYVDAPVGGTVEPARSGKLVVFAGGPYDDIKRLEDILAVFARRVFPMGARGNGSKMKMVMNLVLTVYWEAIAEALVMAESGGLDPGAVLDVLAETPAAIPPLAGKRELLLDRSDDVGFDLGGVQKDMRAVMRTIAESGLSAPATAATLDAVTAAVSCPGYTQRDVAKLAAYRRRQLSDRAATK